MICLVKRNGRIIGSIVLSILLHVCILYFLSRSDILRFDNSYEGQISNNYVNVEIVPVLNSPGPPESKKVDLKDSEVSILAGFNRKNTELESASKFHALLGERKELPAQEKSEKNEKRVVSIEESDLLSEKRVDREVKEEPYISVSDFNEAKEIRKKLNRIEKRFFNPVNSRVNFEDREVVRFKTPESTGSLDNAIPVLPPDYRVNKKPIYPAIAREKGYEGTVVLLIEIDQSGKVVNTKVKKSSGYPILDKSALKASRKWLFEPPRVKNAGIKAKLLVPVEFKLQE